MYIKKNTSSRELISCCELAGHSFSWPRFPLEWGTLPEDLIQGRLFHIKGLDGR